MDISRIAVLVTRTKSEWWTFKSFVFLLDFCFVILFFYSTKVPESSIKCTAQRVAACTPTLRTDSGMDSSGTNMHIDLANIIIPGKQQKSFGWTTRPCTYRFPKSTLQCTLHDYECYFFLSHRAHTHTHTHQFTIIPSSEQRHSHNLYNFVCQNTC